LGSPFWTQFERAWAWACVCTRTSSLVFFMKSNALIYIIFELGF
jgi:hypothetical protein